MMFGSLENDGKGKEDNWGKKKKKRDVILGF